MQVLQEIGFGLNRDTVGSVVMDYVRTVGRENLFNQQPGEKWWKGFLKRHPDLVQRKPQHLSRHRAIAGNRSTITRFITKLDSLFGELKIADVGDLGDRIWNCDESGICTSVASTRVIARKGARFVHETTGGSGREVITVHAAVSASGKRLPPFVVYKGKNLYTTWMNGGPEGAVYSASESGWMEGSNFLSWFKKLFLPAVQDTLQTGPVVLIFDGHHLHLTIELLETAKRVNVHLVCLPAHTSHLLQPLDVGVYGPMKTAWRKILKDFKTSTRAVNVNKDIFPSLLRQLWANSITPSNITGGFRASGIHPLDVDRIPPDKLAPSLPFTSSENDKTTCTNGQLPQSETPLRTELRDFFVKKLAVTKDTQTAPKSKRRRIHLEGEAVTNDDVIEWLKKDDAEKKKKQARKGKGKSTISASNAASTKRKRRRFEDSNEEQDKDTTHCFTCGGTYMEGEEDQWVGCDDCYRWYHYQCAGFTTLPSSSQPFTCVLCK